MSLLGYVRVFSPHSATPLFVFRSKRLAIAAALLAVAALGYIDCLTSTKVGISAFYLLPVSLTVWVVGRTAGLWMAALCSLVWGTTNYFGGLDHSHRLILGGNTLILWSCFTAVACLVASLHDAHYHLERMVAQRTSALEAEIAERKRLEQAKLQAERLAVAGTMAAQLAHEIRNPLGSITLNLDLACKEIEALARNGGHPPRESRTLINEMRAEVARIQAVLGDYLAFARLPKPDRAPVDLNELFEEKLAFMRAAFSQSKIELRRQFDPAMPAVLADADQIWQAVLNLVQNAIDVMPSGGTLTFVTGRSDSDAFVRVSDTGTGMTKEQAAKLFIPFFSTKARGTGLGLAIVQQIVAEHHGHVECRTVRGRGSTFTIYLPLGQAAA